MVDGMNMQTHSRTSTRAHIDGIKVSVRGSSDEGFCVDIGHRGKDRDGLAVDIEFETASDAWYQSTEDDKPLSSI